MNVKSFIDMGSHPLVKDKNKLSILSTIVRFWKFCSCTSLKKNLGLKKLILHHDHMHLHTSSKMIAFLTKHVIEVMAVWSLALFMPDISATWIKIWHQWSSCYSGKISHQFFRFERVCQNMGEVEGKMGQMYCFTWSLFWKRVYSWIKFWSWLFVFCGGHRPYSNQIAHR